MGEIILDYFCGSHVITGVLISEGGKQESQRKDVKTCQKSRGKQYDWWLFEDGRGHRTKMNSSGNWKDKETGSPLEMRASSK